MGDDEPATATQRTPFHGSSPCAMSSGKITAFSPTVTMPLSTRAKLLMSVQSLAALLTSLLVIARAVSVLH
ncbi:hypothetical protein [Streptomyces sp. NPDC059753]|uniref:hypothetical protein n=1 Tax=Streptomyces sp. NPDC059753 TaxID=3346933 RepID=UPI00365A2C52